MRTKLNVGVEATPEEFINSNVPNKFTVLIILDKLYALFRNHELIGTLLSFFVYKFI